MNEEQFINNINEVLDNTRKLLNITTRTETKVSHDMTTRKVNTTNEIRDESQPDLISLKAHGNMLRVDLLHQDITLLELNNFLRNHYGDIIVSCQDKVLYKICK